MVFIAGGSRGIGFGIARAFLQEGAKVAIAGRTASSLADAKKTLSEIADADNIFTVVGDMTQSTDIAAALDASIAALGQLSIVVANVGIGISEVGWDISDDVWNKDIAQNFSGSMFVTREAIRRFCAGPEQLMQSASIVMISSIAGIDAMPAPVPYGASKAAVNYATALLAKTVAKHGIRINAVAPGNIMFPEGEWARRLEKNPEAVQRYIDNEVAMRRFGTPEEIADAVVWLASERASFVTGTTMVVDGGQLKSFG